MKCQEFINRLDGLSGAGISQDMEKHLVECEDCRDYYAVISVLTPKVYPKTPEDIKPNVLKMVKSKKQFKTFITMKTKTLRLGISVAAVAAVVLVSVMIGNPSSARAAENLIDKSLVSIGKITSMVMRIDVRTDPKGNFSDINIDDQMVEHTLTVVQGNQTKWRLDKGWRCIMFDGTTKYMWTPDNSLNVMGNKGSGFEEWFNILLDPEMTLLSEKIAIRDRGVVYTKEEFGNDIIITADVKAKGDFTNPYLRNTSIEESDTRREITFDKRTSLIKSMKIYVKEKSSEILVIDIKSIEYNVPVNEVSLTALPEGREWRDVNATIQSVGKFVGISPEDAAKIIFTALENNDTESIKEASVQYNDLSDLCGIKIIRLGKSFKSGQYPGVFVPYEIKLPNGDIKKHNLALRNDNPNKVWIIDGGIL